MMPVRRTVTSVVLVACAALAAPLLMSSPAATAAPDLRPSGPANIRIDGGTAIAKDLGNRRYRLVMPGGVTPTWFGPAQGIEGISGGRFTPKQLVSSWSLLGHKVDVGIYTTLTWKAGGKDEVTSAQLTRPRVNGDGRLTFVVRSREALPRVMKDFSVNIEGIPPVKPSSSLATRDTLAQTGPLFSIPGSTVTMQAFQYVANFSYAQMWIYGDCGTDNTTAYTNPYGKAGWARVNGTYQYSVSFTGVVCSTLKFWDADGTTTSPVKSDHSQMLVDSSRTEGEATAIYNIKDSQGVVHSYSQQLIYWPGA